MRKSILAVSGFCLVLACQPVQPSGHSHGAGGSHSHSSTDDHQHTEDPTFSFTQWTDQVELFVEFPPLVVGEISRFAAHFTTLSNHKPIEDGSVTVSLIMGNKGIRQTVNAPISPGIFTPGLAPNTIGKGQLVFDLVTPGISEKIVLLDIPVFATTDEALEVLAKVETADGAINFPKEQAWKIDFLLNPVQTGEIAELIHTTGEILPMHGDEQVIAAPSSGLIVFTRRKMVPGRTVRRGELLFTLVPTGDPNANLEAQLEQAKATLKQTESEYLRRKELLENKTISQKDFEESELGYNLAKVDFDNLSKYLSEGGRKVYASNGGYLKSVNVDPGDFVETGTTVLTITQNRKLQLVADLPQQYFPKLPQIKTADFRTLYNDQLQSITQYNGRLISYAQSISLAEPFIPIYFEMDNIGNLLPGAYVELFLHTGVTKPGLTIPRTALLEEYGNFNVMVQIAGESFEKRPIRVGIDNGVLVEVLDGLEAGERIVTKGAYQVKMASMSAAIPSHGHSH